MADFGLTNLLKTKSHFVLSRLPPKTDVPIDDFMITLEEIDGVFIKALSL